MVFENIILYIVVFFAGLIFQEILPGQIRMFLIYPMVAILAFASFKFSNFYLLTFAFGMTSRALIGGYLMCVFLETVMIILGILAFFLIH